MIDETGRETKETEYTKETKETRSDLKRLVTEETRSG